MGFDLKDWPQALIEYGPYAILVLFILLVVPRSSKRLQQITSTAPRVVKEVAAGAVVVSWGVVLTMVIYIMFSWSPVRVYEGQLGILDQSEQIYSLDGNLYVKASGVRAPGRQRWQFALVDKERNINKNGEANFTYCWGQDECTDYIIPYKYINGNALDIKFTKKDSETAYKWNGANSVLASALIGRDSQHFAYNLISNAFADDGVDLKQVTTMLASGNRILRAEGRKALRQLSDKQIEEMEGMTDDPNVLHQIQLEKKRREDNG